MQLNKKNKTKQNPKNVIQIKRDFMKIAEINTHQGKPVFHNRRNKFP